MSKTPLNNMKRILTLLLAGLVLFQTNAFASLHYPQRASEQVLFRELFTNSDYVRDNGGTLVGSPTVASGITLNGSSQYVTYPTNSFILNGKTALTFEMWFSPSFSCTDGVYHYFFDTTNTAGARCLLAKQTDNTLTLYIGSTAILTVADNLYSAYWNVNKPNHIAIAAVTGSIQVYLNNNLIKTSATAWVQTAQPAVMSIGDNIATNSKFSGTIHSFSIYSVKWDANEVADAYNKCTFTEIAFSKAVVHLPCKSIYANTGDGVMLGTDMDMEAADTSAWTAGNSATLTKETGTRTGGSGTKVLRVARNGVNNPAALQIFLTVGKTYRVTGWVRGDGTAYPSIILGSSGAEKKGTTSTDWQYIDFTGACAGSTTFYAYVYATVAGYSEFDDLQVQEVDFLTENQGTLADVKVGDSGLYGVTQAQYNGFVYDGANSLLDYGSDILGVGNITLACVVSASSLGESNVGMIFNNGKLILSCSATNNTFRFSSDGGVTPAYASSNLLLSFSPITTVIVTRASGTNGVCNIYINGILSGTANQSSGTPVAATTNTIIGNNSVRSGTFAGTIKYPTIWTSFIATPTQVRELHNKLMAMVNK